MSCQDLCGLSNRTEHARRVCRWRELTECCHLALRSQSLTILYIALIHTVEYLLLPTLQLYCPDLHLRRKINHAVERGKRTRKLLLYIYVAIKLVCLRIPANQLCELLNAIFDLRAACTATMRHRSQTSSRHSSRTHSGLLHRRRVRSSPAHVPFMLQTCTATMTHYCWFLIHESAPLPTRLMVI